MEELCAKNQVTTGILSSLQATLGMSGSGAPFEGAMFGARLASWSSKLPPQISRRSIVGPGAR